MVTLCVKPVEVDMIFLKYSLTRMLLCFQLRLVSPKHNLRGNRSSNLSADPDMREQGKHFMKKSKYVVGEKSNILLQLPSFTLKQINMSSIN